MERIGFERAVADAFEIPGRWQDAVPYGSGHINETFLVTFEDAGQATRWIQQRINRNVFREPGQVMENVARVTAHQRRTLEAAGIADAGRRALSLVPTRDGGFTFVDGRGEHWRTFRFIEDTTSHDVVRGPADARHAAAAFGRFQSQLADLPGARLHETIPRFHHGRARLEALLEAARGDACDRLRDCRPEFDFVLAREPLVDRLLSLQEAGAIPERITHNDTKLNNVLFDRRTGDALCVIDLDTVMPGLALYDFGDLARTAVSPTAEDEQDLARVDLQTDVFRALVEGYLEGARSFVTPAERAELAFSALFLTLLVGIRFLTDHLAGDTYFRVHRQGHNLDRARTQLRLVASMERAREQMERIVALASTS